MAASTLTTAALTAADMATVAPCQRAPSGTANGCLSEGAGALHAGGGTLNADPFNARAEEQALQECTAGVDVRRVWSELEMVRSFGGHIIPGTPDGMFENWDGALTCVQVVRVPIVSSMSVSETQQVLAHTILTKVVKSQNWLRCSHVSPEEFVIFCWLPHEIPEDVAQYGRSLMQWVKERDDRFYLRLRLPGDTSALFPALFAHNHEFARKCGFSESDVSTFNGYEESDGESECCAWDITWGWDGELAWSGECPRTPCDDGRGSPQPLSVASDDPAWPLSLEPGGG